MKKPLVAIVDDDSAFSSYLRTFLSLRGYETRAYSRGDEMLAAIRQGDPPDIVLLDVMMPGMDGLETLRNLKAARPELQAIMLSGRERASTIVEAVQLGAANYVDQAGRPRRHRRGGTRGCDQERNREEPTRVGVERTATAVERRSGSCCVGTQRADGGDHPASRSGRRQ